MKGIGKSAWILAGLAFILGVSDLIARAYYLPNIGVFTKYVINDPGKVFFHIVLFPIMILVFDPFTCEIRKQPKKKWLPWIILTSVFGFGSGLLNVKDTFYKYQTSPEDVRAFDLRQRLIYDRAKFHSQFDDAKKPPTEVESEAANKEYMDAVYKEYRLGDETSTPSEINEEISKKSLFALFQDATLRFFISTVCTVAATTFAGAFLGAFTAYCFASFFSRKWPSENSLYGAVSIGALFLIWVPFRVYSDIYESMGCQTELLNTDPLKDTILGIVLIAMMVASLYYLRTGRDLRKVVSGLYGIVAIIAGIYANINPGAVVAFLAGAIPLNPGLAAAWYLILALGLASITAALMSQPPVVSEPFLDMDIV